MDDERNPDCMADMTRCFPEREETAFDVADMVLGKDGDKPVPCRVVKISRRELQPEQPFPPDRKESPKRSHTFQDAEGMAIYLKKYGVAHDEDDGKEYSDVLVLADATSMTIQAVLDETAETGFEVLTCKPVLHPVFEPWEKILGHPIPIRAFAAFVMEHRRAVVGSDAEVRELVMTLRQVHASIQTEISQGIGNGATNGMMVTLKIEGKDKRSPVELPDTIKINVPIFINTVPLEIEIDLIAMANTDEGVLVTASAAMVLEAKTKAFAQMVNIIEQAVPDSIVTFGTVDHEKWEYIPNP